MILLQPENVVPVDSGAGLTLTCVVYGFPAPDITWYSNGNQVNNGSSNALIYESLLDQANISFTLSILELCPVTLEDGGNYTCYAINTEGNHTVSFQVMVVQGMRIVAKSS